MKKIRLSFSASLLVGVFISLSSAAQKVDNALLWKVSGKNLSHPSYLFGTFHLMGSEYIDSLATVKKVFNSSGIVIGELVLDNSMAPKIMQAAMMKDTTLHSVLSERTYNETSAWLKELVGMDLKMFDSFSPTMVQMMIVTLIQQKMNGKAIVPMDLYFQNMAKGSKRLVELESFDEQVNVLFHSSSYRQQARHLAEFVDEKEKSIASLIDMNRMYRNQDLNGLMKMFFETSYSTAEKETLLDNRNKAWMKKLPALFEEGSCFVAVGALHLPGQNGIVELLRKSGYTVTPLKLKE